MVLNFFIYIDLFNLTILVLKLVIKIKVLLYEKDYLIGISDIRNAKNIKVVENYFANIFIDNKVNYIFFTVLEEDLVVRDEVDKKIVIQVVFLDNKNIVSFIKNVKVRVVIEEIYNFIVVKKRILVIVLEKNVLEVEIY